MLMNITRKFLIKWECPSNSEIDGQTAASTIEDVYKIEDTGVECIPRKGEIIICDDKELEVVNVLYHTFTTAKKHFPPLGVLNYIEIRVAPKIIHVDYYKYMKRFTHCVDYMKITNDVTRIDRYTAYKKNLPLSIDEWLRDIEDLKRTDISAEELVKMANRRCKLVLYEDS